MPSSLLLLTASDTELPDRSVKQIAEFMGLDVNEIRIGAESPIPFDFSRLDSFSGPHILVSSRTLGRLSRDSIWFSRFVTHISQSLRSMLVYGFSSNGEDGEILKTLTNGRIPGATALPDARTFTFADSMHDTAAVLKGFSFASKNPQNVCAFSLADNDPSIDILLRAEQRPLAVSLRLGQCRLFLLARSDSVDIENEIPSTAALDSWYSGVLPIMVFLRMALPGFYWENLFPGATLIIDDPLLKPGYGCVRYHDLLEQMRLLQCALTIGFIPYNYRRSDSEIIREAKGNLERFSITVHGCDHTREEFGTVDGMLLEQKIRLAVERMNAHEKIHDFPYDKVMIPPQGFYSTHALKALGRIQFAAAVNTSPFPTDHVANPLRVRDLMDAAITKYHAFPLFLRRYPDDLPHFAVDLFLGKPVLVAGHHDFFNAGYGEMASVVGRINGLDARVKWQPLQRNLAATALYKKTTANGYSVKVFTSQCRIRNPGLFRCSFQILKRVPEEMIIERVERDGRRIDHATESGTLECEVELEPNADCGLEVICRNDSGPVYKGSSAYACRVGARRALSEFRDNLLPRHERAYSLIMRLAKKLLRQK